MIGRHGLILLSLCLGLNAFLIDYSFEQLWLGLTSKFKSKCASVGGPQAYSDLQVAVSDLNGCSLIQFNKPDTICTEQRGKSYKCYENFFEKFQKCLDPQEEYIKDLVLFAHNITFDNNCRDEGNDLLVKRSKFQGSSCHKHGEEIFRVFVKTCAQGLSIVRNLYKRDDVITETDLCNDIESLAKCDINVSRFCKDHEDFQNFLQIVFGSYQEACTYNLEEKKAVQDLIKELSVNM